MMKKVKRLKNVMGFIMLLLILGQECSVLAAEDLLPSGVRTADLEEEIAQFVVDHNDTTAGMAVAVFNQDEELLRKYYGYIDVEKQIIADENAVFEWGSATKLLVWVSVMQLYEQGKLDFNADIQEYLPENFLTNLKYDTPVTMLHLMNHNAGFQEVYPDLMTKDINAFADFEEALAAHKPAQIYPAGTVTAYSNWGAALAGLIVERVSGMSFYDYVHQNIFQPLGMEHSAVAMDLSDNRFVQEQRRLLQCYTKDKTLIPDCFYYITLYPAGMCTSTLEDFERFAKALLDEDSALFQKKDTWQELFTPTAYYGTTKIPLNCHGFWSVLYGVQTFGHGGNTVGCSSYLLLDLVHGIGAVVMTNQANETIYNEDMMELIFGKFQRSLYAAEQPIPDGIYRTTRTVRKGPLKCMSLSFKNGDVDEDKLWVTDNSTGITRIAYSYGDDIALPIYTVILEMGLFLLWIAAVIFSLIMLVAKLIRFLYIRISGILKSDSDFARKIRKQPSSEKVEKYKFSLAKWSTFACLLQVTMILLLAGAMGGVSSFARGDTYAWIFAVIGIIAAAMGITAGYGIWKNKRTSLKKSVKVLNYSTAAFLLITAANIFYWDLYMFWAL